MRLNYHHLDDDIRITSTLSTLPNFADRYYEQDIFSDSFNSKLHDYFNHFYLKNNPGHPQVTGLSYSKIYKYSSNFSNFSLPLPMVFESSFKLASETFDKIENLSDSSQLDFDQIYPISVRYTDGKNIFLVERPPFYANIQYNTSRAYRVNTKNDKTAQMWMPWTVMLIYMNPSQSNYAASLFFNDSPIQSLDDLAVPCFHMNMYEDGKMCLNQSSIMLQQHLAEINSYNIQNVYNFLINDYMSGGWNADLSLNSFEKLSYSSHSLREVFKVCYQTGSKEKDIKSPTTPTGRVSYPKYYNNYIKYFSSLSLDEVLSLISSVKSEISKKDYYASNTYNKHISSLKHSSFTPFSIFEEHYYGTNFSISDSYRILLDQSHLDENLQIPKNLFQTLYQIIFNYNMSKYSEYLQTVKSNISDLPYNYKDTSYNENPSLFITKDLNILEIKEDFDYDLITLPVYSQEVV